MVNVQTDKKSRITSRVEREIHGDIMNVTMTVLQTSVCRCETRDKRLKESAINRAIM